MKNAYNTSAYGSFAYVYDIFMEETAEILHCNGTVDEIHGFLWAYDADGDHGNAPF